ncbi:MAG TPA: endonuclease/exonuclease/phosphatase family protein [Polyangia bacterium]|nr:endonuclease/exonuclease/phosphatase family protein [Polyangia bacterium]
MPGPHLRFVTLNLWGENGPWAERLALVGAELDRLAPDVVALQEVRQAEERVPNQAVALAEARGWHHVFAPSTNWGGGQEGLAILSRFPIGAHDWRPLPHSTETEGRIVLSARVDSDLGPIWAHSTHLSYRENEGLKREAQVLTIDEVVTAHAQAGDAPQIVMGDFNTVPESDEIRWLTGLCTLAGRRVFYQDAWACTHAGEVGAGAGATWTRANDYTEGMFWLRRDRRLDYIFVTPVRRDRRGTISSAALAFHEPQVSPNGERLFASDHFGLVADVRFSSEAAGGGPERSK